MLQPKVTWNLGTVLSIHILRLVVGLLLVQFVMPKLFPGSSFAIEVMDRLVVIALVWLAISKHQGNFRNLGLSREKLGLRLLQGLVGGIGLLFFSLYSERLYSTVLFLTPTQHPLVAMAKSAATWQALLAPLFLAGIAAPVAEEILYRLFTFLPFKERWGLWGGAIISAALFALMHFNAYWLGEMMVVGIGLALLYYFTGSLISAITAHAFINTTKIIMLFIGAPMI
ncbi:MAG: CPBP family intramembrane metalloprotease [Pelosinus sp.]|nr:CPBP family intramembrane metalloprotease [Pelosinus sp.]